MSEVAETPLEPSVAKPVDSTPWRRLAERGLWRCVAALTLLGVLIRFTVQDKFLTSAIVFYATPLPLLVLGAAVCTLGLATSRRHVWTGCWLILLVCLAGVWVRHDWRWLRSNTPTFAANDPLNVQVLFWNVARRTDLRPAAAFIRQRQPDVVGLLEVEGPVADWKKFWQEELPEYDVSALGGLMYLLVKGTSGETQVHHLGGGSEARQLKVDLHGAEYDFVLVDINANPVFSRAPALEKLAQIADAQQDRLLVVMGDFNTPTDSVHYGPLRQHHRLTFEVSGRGYGPTWPIPLPLMQLDQIWTNSRVESVNCRHLWSWASDHQPVEVTIRRTR